MNDKELFSIMYSLKYLEPYFKNPDITDIYIHKGNVSVKEFGLERRDTGIYYSPQEVRNIIVQISNYVGRKLDYDSYPVLETTVPYYGARITGLMYWTEEPVVIIRKRPQFVFSLDTYVSRNQLSEKDSLLIKNAIKERKNILVSGGPGSGKTTFTNAILKEMALYEPSSSFFIVEDTSELICEAKYAEMITVPSSQAKKAIELALRSSPDRIIFGEVRTGEVMKALLDSWNTGCPGGVATIHANSAFSTMERITTLLGEENVNNYPIKSVLDMIVHLRKDDFQGVVVDKVIETKNI